MLVVSSVLCRAGPTGAEVPGEDDETPARLRQGLPAKLGQPGNRARGGRLTQIQQRQDAGLSRPAAGVPRKATNHTTYALLLTIEE
jgi:hypothetical protein